jgi:hypothetical protein
MPTTKPRKTQQRNSGRPGGRKGRRDEVGRSRVYPASGPLPPRKGAVIRGQAEWGQGERGAAGYEDHGESEMMTLPPSDNPLNVRQQSANRPVRKEERKRR